MTRISDNELLSERAAISKVVSVTKSMRTRKEMQISDDWEDGLDEYPCDHEDRDINPVDGRAQCYRCGAAWYASDEELAAEHRHQAEYAKWEKRENRRQWWRDLFAPIIDPVRTLKRRLFEWRLRRQFPEHVNDDIPF